MKDIAIYGCGGFGREVACLIERINESEPQWNFIGFYDDGHEKGFMTDMGPVIGNADDLNAVDKPLAIAIAIGSPKTVKAVREKIVNKNIEFPNLIDPSTVFLKRELVKIGEGNIICQKYSAFGKYNNWRFQCVEFFVLQLDTMSYLESITWLCLE